MEIYSVSDKKFPGREAFKEKLNETTYCLILKMFPHRIKLL